MPTNNSSDYSPVLYNTQTGGSLGTLNNVAPHATSGTPFCSTGSSSQPAFNVSPTTTSITISNAPSNNTDGANKLYVDQAVAAVTAGTSVYAATTVDIPGVYTPVGAGVGDTFVTTAVGSFTLDGTSPPLNSKILFKDQNTTFQNGIYSLTINGTGITGTTFTRSTDYDTAAEMNSTGLISVVNGTVNALTAWILNVVVTTIGTDPITYTQFSGAPITTVNHYALVGAASNQITSVNPGAVVGIPFVAQGTGVDPAFSTAVVAGGGTGRVTLTNHGIIVGAGTSAVTQLSAGSSGQVLQSGGASADPAYSTATYPSTASTSGKVLQSDGTNFTQSTPTYPSISGSSGKILISDGTNIIYSTPTYPNSASTTGTLLRADGTNWVATTSTYPDTNAINTLLYASSANVMSALATANDGVLITSNTGIPSLLTNGTTGQVLTATTGSPPSWANATAAGTITQYNVLIGDVGNQIASVPPSATTGIPLISMGSASNPTFGTAVVAGGGTGKTAFSAWDIITGGTTATGALQQVSGEGVSGYVLTSNGASALPTWQAVPNTGGTVTTVTVFTSSGTWTKQAGSAQVIIACWNGGNGGGSGRQGTSGSSFGGGGGTCGGVIIYRGLSSQFSASETVTVGSGGTGGAAQASGGSNGNYGNKGGQSSVGSISASRGTLTANTTSGIGGPGTNSSGVGGVGVGSCLSFNADYTYISTTADSQRGYLYTTNTGGTGTATTGNVGDSTAYFNSPVSGAGGGGGGADSGTARAGGNGGNLQGFSKSSTTTTDNPTIIVAGGTGGIETGTVNGTDGAQGYWNSGGFFFGGGGGGGGGGMKSINPGTGGTGGLPSGGGGGGGGSITGTASGAGGAGGAGLVVIYEISTLGSI